jgi:hypothetical protein
LIDISVGYREWDAFQRQAPVTHHEQHILEHLDVSQGVARNQDKIGFKAFLDAASSIIHL